MFDSVKKQLIFGALIIGMMIALPLLYQQPKTSLAGAGDTFRINEYFLADGTFTGTSHNLTLNQDLATNYFVIIQGSDGDGSGNNDRGPDENYVSLTSDPSGTGDLAASGANNRIGLTRNNAVNSWVGVITVVECLSDCSSSGFRLLDVQRVAHSGANTSGSDTSNVSWSNINQAMLLGGFNGAGCDTAETSVSNTKSCHARIYPSGFNTINWTRSSTGASLSAATSTVMALEWGSEWTVQRRNVTGNNGGNGASAITHYDTSIISSVNRDDTWVWGTGHTDDNGIGDAAEATLITLGNGVNQLVTETLVAVGQEYSDNRSFEVYALTHDDLIVDYRFQADGNSGSLTVDVTVDNASDNTARMALSYNGTNGTGTAYPRPFFSARYNGNSTVRLERRRSGQNFPAWVQGIDFSAIQPGVDLSTSTKTHDDTNNSVLPSQTLTFTITVKNTGTINTTGVDIDDNLDANMENLSVTSLTGCGTFTDNSTSTALNIDDADITTAVDCVIVFTANVKSGVAGGTNIPNTAQIGAADQGGSAFNINSPTVTVEATTDIALTKTSDVIGDANKDDTVVYTITATNNGPDNATMVSIYDILPSGMTFVSAAPSQGTFNSTTGLWQAGSITNGSNATLNISATVDGDVGANITNTATLTNSSPADVTIANNSASTNFDVAGGGSGGGGSRRLRGAAGDYCGDGILYVEECDDGNNVDNDGCSATCSVETQPTPLLITPGLVPLDPEEFEATDSVSAPSTVYSECPYIDHPQVCRNLSMIFGDNFGNTRRKPTESGHGSAYAKSCLSLNKERALRFNDLNDLDTANPFINLLKNTRLDAQEEYIFSGQGSASNTSESVAFGPNTLVTREAVVKTILISNCIIIPDEIPVPTDGFRFSDISVTTSKRNRAAHYRARIFYTAYETGIVKGYADKSARPDQLVSNAELISMLLRASGANENAVEGNTARWYETHTTFASNNGLYNDIDLEPESKVTRRTFAKLLVRSMAYHPNPRIHSYIQRVNLLEQSYDDTLPTHAPLPSDLR